MFLIKLQNLPGYRCSSFASPLTMLNQDKDCNFWGFCRGKACEPSMIFVFSKLFFLVGEIFPRFMADDLGCARFTRDSKVINSSNFSCSTIWIIYHSYHSLKQRSYDFLI